MGEIISYEERYRKYKQELDGAFTQAAEKFVLIGYLLREAAETDILRSSGYKNMEEFAYAEYGVDASQANRFININRRFSEGGNSKQLKQQYQGIGSSKLAVMLTIPDEINEVLPKNLTKEELKEIQAEVKAENQVSDIEVEIERAEAAAVTDKPMLPPEGSPLKRNLWQLGKEQEELFRKLWEICNKGQYPRSTSIMDALIPQGDAVYTVRIPGERRTQIIINSDGATIVNLKTLERSRYTEDQICDAVRSLIDGGSSPEEQYKKLYGEDLTPEEPEIAPVQPTDSPKEKKPEKRKESRVTKANTEPKKKPKEPEKKPEQMTIPGAAPDPAPEEPETQVTDSCSGESEQKQNTDTMGTEEQVPGQTDIENDFPQYCPSEGDQRAAYRQSIRGSVENLVRYVEMDLIVAARQQLSDISGYLDRLEELSKGGGQNVEDVETGESEGV
ncbi:hypothetical protein [Waltera intestinalis]|uniref:Uncharacterized protein n=1 Tax=Waltera intestinalis TaxID=2606635 RepID=A0A6L5YIA8_9FIRM|nr:hypothetical protein [Waltera intestinalis]MST57909.1 hypothetical protein [Waltera intestinalis]